MRGLGTTSIFSRACDTTKLVMGLRGKSKWADRKKGELRVSQRKGNILGDGDGECLPLTSIMT